MILIGDCRVGKTSFLNYVVGRNVNHKNPITPTIGVEWAPIAIQAHGRSVCVNIWDTCMNVL